MSRSVAEPWLAALTSLQSILGTFYWGPVVEKNPQGSAGGTPLVNGFGQTGDTVATDGWPSSVTNILKRGDYIQIGPRLHKVTADVNSNGSGQATISVWPDLAPGLANDAAIITNSPKGIFYLIGDPEWTTDVAGYYYLNFSIRENLV